MTQVEKLSIEIEATNNVKAGLNSVMDNIAGFKKRTASERAIALSLNLADLQTKKSEAERQLRELKSKGDILGQISVRADIAIFKQNINQAQRELTNFARTGQENVSVLGKLFGGMQQTVSQSAVSIKSMVLAFGGLFSVHKLIQGLKASLLEFSKNSKEMGDQVEEDTMRIGDEFARLKVTIGKTVYDAVQGFFSMFGSNLADGLKAVRVFVAGSVLEFKKFAATFAQTGVGNFVVGAIKGPTVKEKLEGINAVIEAENAYNKKLNEGTATGFLGMKAPKPRFPVQMRPKLTEESLSVQSEAYIRNILAGTRDLEDYLKGTSEAKKAAEAVAQAEKEYQDTLKAVEKTKGEGRKKAEENQIAASKKLADASKKEADQKKKDAEEYWETYNRLDDLALENAKKNIEEEKRKRKELKGVFVDAYGSINSELEKAKDAVADLDKALEEQAKKRKKEGDDAAKSLGERYVEVEKEISDITAGKENGDNLGSLFKERAILLEKTTPMVLEQAKAYAAMNRTEQIIYDRDLAITAIDDETKAIQDKLAKEQAALEYVNKIKINLEAQYTKAFQENITEQIKATDQLIQKLREGAQAAREFAAAKASAGAGSSTVTNNVTVNNDVKNGVDAKIVTNAITSKLSS